MTVRTKTSLNDGWGHEDPEDWKTDLLDSLGGGQYAARTSVTYGSVTQTLITVPADSLITRVMIARTTAWDAITTFEVGKSGDTDWLADTTAANVTGAISGTEEGEVEVVDLQKVVTTATPIILTLNQGGASAGVGYVVVEYKELT